MENCWEVGEVLLTTTSLAAFFGKAKMKWMTVLDLH